MERWKNKVAVVTGASSGIGAAIAVKLAQNGITVLGLARRVERIQELAEKCKTEKGCIVPRKADITKEDELLAALKYAHKFMGGIDILVNNAGTTVKTNILDGDTDAWRRMFELNVMTLSITMRELIKSVKERTLTDGYIINISSVAAHRLPQRTANIVYAASKAAAKIITEGARMELAAMKSEIKITNLSPGVVSTEIFAGGGWGDEFSDQPQLKAEDIADAVMYLLENPLYVQVPELTVRKNGEGW